MRRASGRILGLLLLTLAAATGWAAGHSHQGGQGQKQSKDATADANPATETFDPGAVNQATTQTANGGIRRVVANESSDAKQIGLIRANLKALADKFGPGSFAGQGMATGPAARAVAILQSAAPEKLRAQYLEVRAGAELRYSSDDPSLAAALREWLAAQ
jgi:hypothetical protein